MGVSGVAEVDPMDDTIWRWVIHHYRFDPERRQRRDVVVAAFDNAAELEAAVNQYHLEIQVGIDGGVRDDRERVTGVVWHPGYHSERARGGPWRPLVRGPGAVARRGRCPVPARRMARLPHRVSCQQHPRDRQGLPLDGMGDPTPQHIRTVSGGTVC